MCIARIAPCIPSRLLLAHHAFMHRKLMLHKSKRLAYQSLASRAHHGVANRFAHAQPEAMVRQIIWQATDRQRAGDFAHACVVHGLKLQVVSQAMRG